MMAYARWTEKEVESVMDMLDEGLTPLQVARQFPGRSVISVRSKCYDIINPSRRYKKTVRKKKIPEMIPGEEYDIMCPQFWQPIGQGGKKNGAVKKMQLVDVSEGVHTRHYVFKHPEAGWLASFREQDLTKVLIVEKGVM